MKAMPLLAALFLTATPCFAGVTREAIQWNNKGVRALNNSDWQNSIKYFRKSLKTEPKYDLARINLSIAYNNFGLSLKKTKDAAIKQFHKSVFLSPDNETSVANLNGIIQTHYKMNPEDFATRIHFADLAEKENDLIGAYVELKAALSVKDDSDTRKKLDAICNLIKASEEYGDFEKALLNPEDRKIIWNRPVKKITIVPGALEEERKALLGSIQIAEGQGVGISGYMNAFRSLERQVEDGASTDTIQKELNRLFSALDNQVKVDIFSFSPITNYRPKTIYLQQLKTYLKDKLKFEKPASTLKIYFYPNKDGKLTGIELDKKTKSSNQFYQQISESLKALDTAPSPPINGLHLCLKINKNGKVDLYMRDGVDFDEYMKFIQTTIKSEWKPPKNSDSKEIKVRFTIEPHGKISDIKISKSSTNNEQDAAVIKAVNVSSPLPYLPDGYCDTINVEFTFNCAENKVKKQI